jgi:hypothetical protein
MRYNFCSSPPNDAVGKCVYYTFGGLIYFACFMILWPFMLAAVVFSAIHKLWKI